MGDSRDAALAEVRIEVARGVVAGKGELVIRLEGAYVGGAGHDDLRVRRDNDAPCSAPAITRVELGDHLTAVTERPVGAPAQIVSGEGEPPGGGRMISSPHSHDLDGRRSVPVVDCLKG